MACGKADWPNADAELNDGRSGLRRAAGLRLPHILQLWVPLLVVSRAEGDAG